MDVMLPTLAGIARMVPVHGTAIVPNVGASWVLTAYTVPTGRILSVDDVMVVTIRGRIPNLSEINLHNSSGSLQARLEHANQTAFDQPLHIGHSVWAAEGWTLRFANSGGDATTDMIWSFSGRLFDWVDVT